MSIVQNIMNFEKKRKVSESKRKFWAQLKLLLWKNWLLRKRNKLRSLIEIIWPLLMMLMVVLLHEVGEKHTFPNCYMKAKAMPTAGEVLFMQTFLCAINNTCDTEEDARMSCYNSSLMSNLEESLQEAFNIPTSGSKTVHRDKIKRDGDNKKVPSLIQSWMKDFFLIETLMEAIKKHSQGKHDTPNESFLKNYSTNYICNNVDFSLFDELQQRTNTSFIDNVYRSDIKTLSRIKRKIYITGVLKSLYRFLTIKTHKKVGVRSLLDELNILDYIFCGHRVPSIRDQVNSLLESGRKKSRESEETMDPGGAKYMVDGFEWENDTTDFCNELMEKIESTYSTRVVFRLFKPFIRGKLIYTPDAPVINRIMGRINETLSHIQIIIDLIKKETENSEKMDWNFEDVIKKYRNEEMFLREILRTNVGKAFLKNFNSDNVDDDSEENNIKKFQILLDETLQNWINLQADSVKNVNLSNLIPYLECADLKRIIPVTNESAAVKEALKWLNQERLWGLIVFMNVTSDAEELPPSITYKIRTGIERTPDTNQIRDRIFIQRVRRNVIYDLREVTGGFAYLQNMIEGELIREYTGRKSAPGIFLKQIPYPCHIYDTFRDVITRTFPMFMVISWIYIFCTITKRIVLEKEILLKSTLRIFGVTSSQHWISWFIDSFVPMVVVTTILSVLLVFGGLLPQSNTFIIWLFLTTFILPTIALAFMVSTFFFKASFAMAVSGMIYFLLYLPYPPIQNFEEIINSYLKIFACLISNVAFGLGCTWIANMEEIGVGAQPDKISVSPVSGNPITMTLIIQMFIIDSIVYLLLALYFDNVFAAHDYVRQPWNYCFTMSYWRGFSKEQKPEESNPKKPPEKDPRYFEAEPTGLRVGIEVINLTKEFGRANKKRKVVNNLNINFYEDQITSFLGHNGAGKTTTISMMIGLIPITEGTVRIYGVDVKTNPEVAVKNIGICRQENILLDDLTVEEHFTLFARLKNCSSQEVENDVKELIGDLQLGHRAKQPVKILSGGMKRKVCVAMAFIGGSRTVFLDEPTAGIDPYSRRSIWELLLKYKKGRTIILTTHFLDEADLLGDRIAIISSGQLQCCGSSIFLKSHLGRGYYLTIENAIRSDKMGRKAKGLKGDTMLSPQAQELNNLIKGVIPGAEFSEEIGSEIVFILPSHISAENYNTLFTELDKNKEKLNFSSYGVTDTSLEEVFMKVLIEAEEREKKAEKSINNQEVTNDVVADTESPKTQRKMEFIGSASATYRVMNLKGRKMLQEHFVALLIKRFLHHRRNFKIVLFELLLPTLFLAIALALAKTFPSITEMPPLVIDMSAYEPSSLFYSNEVPEDPLISSYVEALLGPYGLGTKCILTPEKCSLKSIPKSSLLATGNEEDLNVCGCPGNYFYCVKNLSLVKPPNAVMSGGDVLYNMTGLNLTNWLITTEHEYSAHRFGGISFGYYNSLSGLSGDEFLNLFMFKRFIPILQKFALNDYVLIDPEVITLFVMFFSCNKTYGEEIFSNKNTADNIVIWFNNRGWIAGIAMMNGVTNLVLRASLPNGTDPSKYSIRLINHPLPITKRQLEDQIELQTNVALLCALSIIWVLSFMPAMYAVYLVEERINGLKHLQIVSGISRIVYWCTNLIWDLVAYFISTLSLIFLFFLFNMTSFVGKENIAEFITLLYSYGFVNITFVYSMSFLFSVPSSAFIFTACWNILTGVTTLLTTFTLTLISSEEDPYCLNSIFMIFHQFCFGKALISMALEGIRRQSLLNFGVKPVKYYFMWHQTTKYVLIMIVFGGVYFVITLLIEYQIFQRFMIDGLVKFLRRPKRKQDSQLKEEDGDVEKERERVQSGKAKEDNDVLIVDNLTKVYSTRESPAVDHICVGIKRGECFGLLGLNGAGKTTVFKLLTGYITPSEGDAIVGGYSIRKNLRQAKLLVGYCPQINALDPYLTPEEHLSFFCRIRGVTGEKKDKEIRSNIERLGLTEHRNKIVKVLSGGNKRKVNTAIALVCDPELVLLDEPTSGMDVLSRRFLWNCIQDVVMEGRCVVLTSHSMEECQALCTHLSIMVNGRFTCFGSSQRLKNKFNEGYNVIVRLCTPDKVEDVMSYFQKFLPGSDLIHAHYLQMKFKLSPEIFIGTVFTTMSRAKKEKLIQDYSISQTTLESIFLKLATSAEGTGGPKSSFTIFKNLCSFGKLLEDEESSS